MAARNHPFITCLDCTNLLSRLCSNQCRARQVLVAHCLCALARCHACRRVLSLVQAIQPSSPAQPHFPASRWSQRPYRLCHQLLKLVVPVAGKSISPLISQWLSVAARPAGASYCRVFITRRSVIWSEWAVVTPGAECA